MSGTEKNAGINGQKCILFRAVGRFENPWVPVLFGGYNLPRLVEIGLTDLQKSGGAMPWPPGTSRDDIPVAGHDLKSLHFLV